MRLAVCDRVREHPAKVVFTITLIARLLAIPTSLLQLNPYSQADAIAFADTARLIATTGTLATPEYISYSSHTLKIWGSVLAPFWLLPGPSLLYAHLFVATLGAIAVYNVFRIGTALHSRQAGLLAAAPIALYPSFVAVHSTLLREAAILFGITTVARVVIAPPRSYSSPQLGGLLAFAAVWATVFRPENVVIYLFAVFCGGAVRNWNRTVTKGATAAAILLAPLVTMRFLAPILARLNTLREKRASGRVEYLGSIRFTGLLDVIGFSVIGALYFLFAPFPWMIETVADVPVAVEALGNIIYMLATFLGVRELIDRRPAVVAALAGGCVLGVVIYGLATVNYGTAVRHRQMFLWVIFLFGAVGLCRGLKRMSLTAPAIRR